MFVEKSVMKSNVLFADSSTIDSSTSFVEKSYMESIIVMTVWVVGRLGV